MKGKTMELTSQDLSSRLILALLAGLICASWLAPFSSAGMANNQAYLEQVLDNWASALGGRERLLGIDIIRVTYRIKMLGMEGTWEEWFTADGKHRADLNLAGIFKVSIVRIPQHCWYLDHNGKVSEMAGKNLEDELRDIYLGTWSHLLAGQMSGDAKFVGLDPKTNEIRVKILPEHGTEVTFWIDSQSYLPVRWESPGELGETVTTTFGKWREFGGILVPTQVAQTTGTPENDTTFELLEIVFNETPPAGTFNKPGELTDDVHFADGSSSTEIQLDVDGVHLFLEGHLNDSGPLWFVLDTGAQMTAIDKEVADELGLEMIGQVMGGGGGEAKVPVSFVQNVSFRVPGVELAGQTLATAALRSILEARAGREVDGILGYDFISRFVVEIDYWNKTLYLYDRDEWEYQGNGSDVPIRLVDNNPVCDATITLPDGRSIVGNFYFDTGSGATISFTKPFTEENDLLSALPKIVESVGGGIGGESHNYLGRIASIKVGDLEFNAPTCSFSQDNLGVGADASYAGKIGGGLLERCTVILDYDRQRIFLEPNSRFGSSFLGPMSGMGVITGGRGDWHTFTIINVIDGSPADEASVKPGDIIVSVDGKPAAELYKRDLTNMFHQAGRKIRFEFSRNGETTYKELTMKPLL